MMAWLYQRYILRIKSNNKEYNHEAEAVSDLDAKDKE